MTLFALHVAGDCGDPCGICDREAELELQDELDTHDCFAPGCPNRPTVRVDPPDDTVRPWFLCDEDASRADDFLDTCPHTPLCLEVDEVDCIARQREEGSE